MWPLVTILSVASATGAAGAVILWKKNKILKKELEKSSRLSEEEAISRASAKAKEIILDAKNKALSIKDKSQDEVREQKKELEEIEKRLLEREKSLDVRADSLNQRENKIESKESYLENESIKIKKTQSVLSKKLHKISGLSRQEAEAKLMEQLEKELKVRVARKIRENEKVLKDHADEDAKRILVDAMQKGAVEYVAETTTTTIQIPSDDMKGRIIGREGRNIRTFEKATGVDVIIDDVPGAITVSCFDPVRREVAAIVMQKLISDGRIHPGRIEEEIVKVKKDLLKDVKKVGEDLAFFAGTVGLPEEIITTLGKFKFRFSYGQNLVKHTKEMIKIGAALASEVNADVELVKTACLLHDIGKVLSHEIDKPHHHISGQILRKHKMDEKLVNAVESHHGDIEPQSVEAVIVYIADALSGSRPGARVENYEEYIKRIQGLEDSAKEVGKDKVKEVYAIHAGREVRVIVNSTIADDNDVEMLSHKIAKHIEETQTYPGTVTVNVIRELRSQETAK